MLVHPSRPFSRQLAIGWWGTQGTIAEPPPYSGLVRLWLARSSPVRLPRPPACDDLAATVAELVIYKPFYETYRTSTSPTGEADAQVAAKVEPQEFRSLTSLSPQVLVHRIPFLFPPGRPPSFSFASSRCLILSPAPPPITDSDLPSFCPIHLVPSATYRSRRDFRSLSVVSDSAHSPKFASLTANPPRCLSPNNTTYLTYPSGATMRADSSDDDVPLARASHGKFILDAKSAPLRFAPAPWFRSWHEASRPEMSVHSCITIRLGTPLLFNALSRDFPDCQLNELTLFSCSICYYHLTFCRP